MTKTRKNYNWKLLYTMGAEGWIDVNNPSRTRVYIDKEQATLKITYISADWDVLDFAAYYDIDDVDHYATLDWDAADVGYIMDTYDAYYTIRGKGAIK